MSSRGSVNIKEMAKWWRKLMVQHHGYGLFSDLLDEWPDTNLSWSMAAEKDNPVGFFRFIAEQYPQGNDITAHYRPRDRAQAVDPALADRVVGFVNDKGHAGITEIARGVGLDGSDGFNTMLDILPGLVAAGRITEPSYHNYAPGKVPG